MDEQKRVEEAKDFFEMMMYQKETTRKLMGRLNEQKNENSKKTPKY